MPPSSTGPHPEGPWSGRPRTHLPRAVRPAGRIAAAVLRLLRERDRPAPQEDDPRHRLALDLDDCRQELARWQRHADSYEQELTHVARERAHLLAWLAALHPSSAVITPVADAGPSGTHLLRLMAGERLLSWRLPSTDLPLFAHVPHTEPTATPPRRDGPGAPDQSAHIRRHTRLLAMEGSLFVTPAETQPSARPPDR
ncbi:hypothetical protein [Streptomyces sp. NPDC096132]|uniref:hypothetical protein n=1 Tax=Streptomyces sp. NPDC096132 TaxID=3366075 RepID=UPI0038082506